MAYMAIERECLSLIIFVAFCLSQVLPPGKHTYLQFGESEEVECPLITDENFSIRDVNSAYWYKDVVATENLVISNFEGTIYEGPSIVSGKYFLTERLSLVINNITASDEGQFFCQLKTGRPGFQTAPVDVTVFVPPNGPSPEVEECRLTDSKDGCLIELHPKEATYHLTCHVINARPAVKLRWLRVFNDGSTEEVTNITYQVNGTLQNVSQIQENYLSSTFATVTEVYHEETTLHCQATGIAMGDRNGAFGKCTLQDWIYPQVKRSTRNSTYNTVRMTDVNNADLERGDETLRSCADQLKTYYKGMLNTIRTHPVFARCINKIKDVFIDLQLLRETGKTVKSEKMVRIKGRRGFYPDNPVKEPLDSQDDLIRLLHEEGHVALVGTAGSGKTTLTRKIACDWACQMAGSVLSRFKLVVVLGMREIQVSQSSGLLDAIQRILPKETELSRANLRDLITNNQKDTLIVLDGLDEVSSQVLNSPPPNDDDFSIKDVISFKALRDCRVLVTTRPHKMNELDSTYAVVETIGFSPANRDKYIGQFFSDKVEKGQALIQEVQSTAFIHTLAQSPIMLLLLCVIWNRDDTLPQQLTKLYERAVDILVSHFLEKYENVSQEEVNAVKDEVGRVAFEGLIDLDGERLVFQPDEFGNSLEGGLKIGILYQESKAVCTQLVEMVNFLHKSFQEFFAAHYLATQATEKIQNELLPQVTVESIQEKEYLLRFCCGMNVNAAATILQHVNGLHEELQTQEFLWIQNFTLVLVFEAQSPNLLAGVGSRLTLKYKEDFPAMEYYLQRFSDPVQLERLNIHLTLITDQSIARKILEGVTVDSLYFHMELSDQLKDQLSDLTTTISEMQRRAKVTRLYVTSSKQCDGKSNTGESGEEMVLENQVNHLCDFIRQQPELSGFGIGLDGKILQSRKDFTVLVDALAASNATYLCIENSSLHGYLHRRSPLFESLTSMVFRCCGLTDDDLNEVSTSLASSPSKLTCLYLQEGSFSHDAVNTLVQTIAEHKTMDLEKLYLVGMGLHATAVTQIVQRYLPKMRESKTGFFIK
ncbi:NACHT, LRR and PYD domains-containing protein 3-like [Patiria miniata]|uniref:Uncharacterized protein n=1 Tax=Patiria miniata TaxID=46514 RepID=A0A913Z3L1_PATMI|nr:NACHT, LRR and PYD domains-containing protein 3-like [Patiria miniata]